MQLSVESVRAGGGFTGPPVKREIEWSRGDRVDKVDVFVRQFSFHALTDINAGVSQAMKSARLIVHGICDEFGRPIFKESDITGFHEDGSPVFVLDEDGEPMPATDTETGEPLLMGDGSPMYLLQGELDSALQAALVIVVSEVNRLGKSQSSQQEKSSSTS